MEIGTVEHEGCMVREFTVRYRNKDTLVSVCSILVMNAGHMGFPEQEYLSYDVKGRTE